MKSWRWIILFIVLLCCGCFRSYEKRLPSFAEQQVSDLQMRTDDLRDDVEMLKACSRHMCEELYDEKYCRMLYLYLYTDEDGKLME